MDRAFAWPATQPPALPPGAGEAAALWAASTDSPALFAPLLPASHSVTPAADLPTLDEPTGEAVPVDSAGGLERLLRDAQSSAHVGPRPVLVPLLPRFGLALRLDVAVAPHPRLPALRAQLDASTLALQLSPWRLSRLLAVVASLAPPADASGSCAAAGAPGTKAGPAAPPPPLWVTDAEYEAPCAVLSWEGVGGRVAKWHARRLHVYRGRLVLSRAGSVGSPQAAESRCGGYRARPCALRTYPFIGLQR